MKRYGILFLFVLLAFVISACAAPVERQTYRRLKCPSCGYEFEVPPR